MVDPNGILISDVIDELASIDPPPAATVAFPGLDAEDWKAAVRFAAMVLIALEGS